MIVLEYLVDQMTGTGIGLAIGCCIGYAAGWGQAMQHRRSRH